MWYDKIGGMEYMDLRKVGREGLKEIHRQVVRLKEMEKTRKIQEINRSTTESRPAKYGQRIKAFLILDNLKVHHGPALSYL